MSKIKMVVRVALIIIIVGSLGYLIAKEIPFSKNPEPRKPAAIKTGGQRQLDHIAAYYFHGNFRCPKCLRIEEYSRSAIHESFPEELKDGSLTFEAVNVEEPENRHFIKDYELYTKSLVVVFFSGGVPVKYKNLTKVWELLGSRDEFYSYVQSEVSAFLSELKK